MLKHNLLSFLLAIRRYNRLPGSARVSDPAEGPTIGLLIFPASG